MPSIPRLLAPLVKVEDPEAGGSRSVTLETDYNSKVVGYRTEPVQKQEGGAEDPAHDRRARSPRRAGTSPLGEEYNKEIAVGSSTKLAVREGGAPSPGRASRRSRSRSPRPSRPPWPRSTSTSSSPADKPRFAADRNELSITGEMAPRRELHAEDRQGDARHGRGGASGGRSSRRSICRTSTPRSASRARGCSCGAGGKHAVAIEAVNVPKVRMTIDRVYLNNLFFLFQYGGFFEEEYGYFGELQHALGDRLKEETLNVGGAKNKRRVYAARPRQVGSIPRSPASTGCRWVSRTPRRRAQRWLLLTDLGAVAKRGPAGDPGLGVVAQGSRGGGGRQGDAALGPEPDDGLGANGRLGRVAGVSTPRRWARARRTW